MKSFSSVIQGALSLLLITTIAVSCKKSTDPDAQGAEPKDAAVFSLLVIENNALQPSNLLQAGAVADSNIYVEVQVEVTRAGDWAISTDTVNGAFFAGSGRFTSTGPFTVKLKAGGKPLHHGMTTYTLAYGVEFTTEMMYADEPPSMDSLNYFKVRIGGQWITAYDSIHYGLYSGTGTFYSVFGTIGFYTSVNINAAHPSLGLFINGMHYADEPDMNEFKAFFTPGHYIYSTLMTGEGVQFEFYGGSTLNNRIYGTISATNNDQEGSDFRIISAKDISDATHKRMRVRMRFNCRMYSDQFPEDIPVVEIGEMCAVVELKPE